jgi:ribulose-5-phosphate 4-epimerase/fuculose-1-phosphate aldolase
MHAGRVQSLARHLSAAATPIICALTSSAAAAAARWQPPRQHEAPGSAEWALRVELAVAYRWAARHQLSEGVCNHFTAEVLPGQFLVIPYGMQWSEVTAASLLLIDANGKVLRGGGPELPSAVEIMEGRQPRPPSTFDETGMLEPTAFYIHGSIHKLLGDRAKVVLHTHMPYATALACTTAAPGCPPGCPPPNRLAFVHQSSSRFWTRTLYEDRFGGLVLDDEGGMAHARLLAQLPEGPLSVLFLANHGVLVCADTVAMAYDSLYYLERTCMLQVLAQQVVAGGGGAGGSGSGSGSGGALQRISGPQLDALHAQKMKGCGFQANKHFGALRRVLEKEEPEFKRSWSDTYDG